MKNSQFIFIPIFLILGLISTSAHATIVFLYGSFDGGLAPNYIEGPAFGFQPNIGPTGSEFVEIESLGVYNSLRWDFNGNAASISSEMLGSTDVMAWVQGGWLFEVTDNPVSFRLDASVNLINTRFRKFLNGSSECLSPGCENDNLYPGTTIGILDPGYVYHLEFSPSVGGPSSFRLQVPEPATLSLLSLGLLGLGFMGRKKSVSN